MHSGPQDGKKGDFFCTYGLETLQSCLLIHLFFANLGDTLPPKGEVLDIYGRIVINSFNIMNNDYQSIGIGLYLAASAIDHSCTPNATVAFEGSQLILRTIEDVQSLEHIRISYTNLLGT